MAKRIGIYGIVGLLLFAVAACKKTDTSAQESEAVAAEEVRTRYEYGIAVDTFRIDTGYVKEGETLGGILRRCGADNRQQNAILTLRKDELDTRQIRAGKQYLALYERDSVLRYWVYIASVREAQVLDLGDSVHARFHQKPVTTIEKTAQATIESSLWNAMVGANLPVDLALELSDIYAWTIDFFGLQKGDSIKVYYEEQYVDTTSIGIGRIFAAHFYHGNRWNEAYWFEKGETQGYFDEKGNSLRKAFLKAPLNYKRISSRFTYARKHPVYKIVRPHTGVDYAAPAGTPVVAIGDGKVIEKGYKGGGGNTIKIRHNSTYTTAYLHLSKYAKGLQVGSMVRQGEVIGYVGSTGASTGPHLDFRVWKNGTPIDPLKMDSPPVEPIAKEMKAAYDSVATAYREKLQTLNVQK